MPLLLLIALAISACSRPADTGAFRLTSKSVHYEAVNSRGEFVAHEEFADDSVVEDSSLQKLSEASAVRALTNPDARNRVALVFVGDGYTKSELNQYNQDIAGIRDLLSQQEPFKTYQNYFSMFSVQTISSRTGVGDEPSTRLGMRYNCNGLERLLCINSAAAMSEARLAPKVDLVFALANSDRYGGAGYREPAISTLAARNPHTVELAVHEMAHSFANLADEYEDAGTDTACSTKPNASVINEAQMAAQKSKWFRWLDLRHVGAYAGSCYSSKVYRPTLNSKMRTLGSPFEEVNLEQMIIAIYKRVQPIEFATQPGVITLAKRVQIVPMKPVGYKLSIEWSLNGQLQKSLNGLEVIDTSKLSLKTGTNILTVKVVDRTTAVRDEDARSRYMTQTLQWKLQK